MCSEAPVAVLHLIKDIEVTQSYTNNFFIFFNLINVLPLITYCTHYKVMTSKICFLVKKVLPLVLAVVEIYPLKLGISGL